jgi:hypothetical protein
MNWTVLLISLIARTTTVPFRSDDDNVKTVRAERVDIGTFGDVPPARTHAVAAGR